jgi:hypothetical protein
VKAETLNPQVNIDSFWPRRIQLAAAVPSLLLWALLSGIALLWCVGVAISAISGRLATSGDWRLTYLIGILLLVLVCSGVTARTLWHAYQGRSLLWWHACTFGLGVFFLGLIGSWVSLGS